MKKSEVLVLNIYGSDHIGAPEYGFVKLTTPFRRLLKKRWQLFLKVEKQDKELSELQFADRHLVTYSDPLGFDFIDEDEAKIYDDNGYARVLEIPNVIDNPVEAPQLCICRKVFYWCFFDRDIDKLMRTIEVPFSFVQL